MDNKAVHSILKYFKTQNGRLLVGGKTCHQVMAEHGSPLYVYDLNVVKAKLLKLKQALPEQVRIHYAIKANPHVDIIRFFKSHNTGVDVASKGELELVIEAGINPYDIGFAGPGKTDDEIAYACEMEIGSLNAESVNELARANTIAGKMGKKINVSLRINPAYELIGSGMKMGGGPKPFGIDQEKVPSVLSEFPRWRNLNFIGFHIFSGSQNLRADAITDSFNKALDTVESLLPLCPSSPRKINLGGGFGIPYYNAEQELDINSIGRNLDTRLAKAGERLKETEFIIESGRYLVGESGIYLATIIDKKVSRGETFLIINGGMHHHLAASGNFGQVLKRNFPIISPEKLDEEIAGSFNIVGLLCTPLDRLGTKVTLPEIKIGDCIGILSSGAYGYTASPHNFLMHKRPLEIVL